MSHHRCQSQKPLMCQPPRSRALNNSSRGSRTPHTSPLRTYHYIFGLEAMTQPNDNILPLLETATMVAKIAQLASQEFWVLLDIEAGLPMEEAQEFFDYDV